MKSVRYCSIIWTLMAILMISGNALAADSPEDVVRKLVDEVWSKGALELTYQLVSPEYQFHNPMIRIVGPTGPELMSSLLENRREAFPDLAFEILDLFAEDQKVVVRWGMSNQRTSRSPGKVPRYFIWPPARSSPSGPSLIMVRSCAGSE